MGLLHPALSSSSCSFAITHWIFSSPIWLDSLSESPRTPIVSWTQVLLLQEHVETPSFFNTHARVELGGSCLCHKQFTYWAISLALPFPIWTLRCGLKMKPVASWDPLEGSEVNFSGHILVNGVFRMKTMTHRLEPYDGSNKWVSVQTIGSPNISTSVPVGYKPRIKPCTTLFPQSRNWKESVLPFYV